MQYLQYLLLIHILQWNIDNLSKKRKKSEFSLMVQVITALNL